MARKNRIAPTRVRKKTTLTMQPLVTAITINREAKKKRFSNVLHNFKIGNSRELDKITQLPACVIIWVGKRTWLPWQQALPLQGQ